MTSKATGPKVSRRGEMPRKRGQMGSKEYKAMGLTSAGDRLRGDPREFTILDVDIPRADLLARYEGKPTEQALIRAVKQERRALAIAAESPEFAAFCESCEGGIGTAIHFYRLRPDTEGKEWKIVVDGNNRTAALRIVNGAREHAGQAPFSLLAIQAERPGSGDDAGKFAEEKHALANVRVRMLPSQSAEIAARFAARGIEPEGIRRYIDGNPPAKDVAALVILDSLTDAIKDAVDAGLVKLAAIVRLEGASEEKQAAWLAKRLAPKPERKPRASKPMQRRAVERIRSELMAPCGESSEDALIWELLSLVTGELEPGKIRSDKLRAAYLRATERGK